MLADSVHFPVCGWLWNVAGPVEGLNCWSSPDVFLRDVARALRRNDLVFAHTVFLQKGPWSWNEFNGLFGDDWLKRTPRDFRLVYESRERFNGIDALQVYRFRLNHFVRKFEQWREQLVKEHRVAGMLTSDHGQEFAAIDGTGRHYSGLHGWDITPESVWIPFVPFGSAEIVGPTEGHLSWMDLRMGILRWIEKRGSLKIERSVRPLSFRTHYIVKSHLSTSPMQSYPADMVTMGKILKMVHLDWREGLFLEGALLDRQFRWSEGWVTGTRLITMNPTDDGGTSIVEWSLYTPVQSSGVMLPARAD
jgi:hypothetical protein